MHRVRTCLPATAADETAVRAGCFTSVHARSYVLATGTVTAFGRPGPTWKPLPAAKPALGCACFHHGDELASLPVRSITRIKDNKSDPNIETGSFGLFSTCEQAMRAGVVSRGVQYLFFVTRPRGAARVLTGYYRLGWFADGTLSNRIRDYALAADQIRFVSPIALTDLPAGARDRLTRRWRLQTSLGAEETAVLIKLLDGCPERTPDYLAEVDRMERINLYHSGYRYPTWRRVNSWSWEDAGAYLGDAGNGASAGAVRNSSSTGRWICLSCGEVTENKALLKLCPHCAQPGTLDPSPTSDPVAPEA